MNKGRRYKKRYKRDTINKKKVFMVVAIIFLIIYCIFNKKEKNNIETSNEETNSKSEETLAKVEPVEDENIKKLVEDLIVEKGLDNSNFALFYYNKNQDKYYFYNEDTYFKGASTVKMPVAMVYYDKIRNGEMTLEDTIAYTSECYEPGGGLTDYTYSVGDEVPINFLIEQSVVNSDNTAVNILVENLGYENYRRQIANYSDIELPEEFYETNITSADYAYDVANHLYENIDNYSELIGYLKISSEGKYLKKYLQNNDVAHKYGSYNGYVHDYGIVFGETNYLIGIFTKNIPNADEFIADTSLKIFNEVNKK